MEMLKGLSKGGMILLTILILATGCATAKKAGPQSVAFPSVQLALMLGDVKAACVEAGTPPAFVTPAECKTKRAVAERFFRKALLAPPPEGMSGFDFDDLMELVGKYGKFAM